MDPSIYQEIIEQEDSHWWFCARRAITAHLLKNLKLPANPRVLDAGCGSGGNLPMLAHIGDVYAFEMNDTVRARAQSRGIGKVEAGKLPDGIPFSGTSFDLITLFDVLEHVEDDRAALQSLAFRLSPGGVLLLSVPAFQWLFGRHDTLHHHFRRYNRRTLRKKLRAAGLEVELINYWNFLLFPVAIVVRIIDVFRKSGEHSIGAAMPSPLINRLLTLLVSSERFLLPHIPLPFGVSLLAIARKPRDSSGFRK